jgi:DnaJ-class molecular chaperone
MRCERCRGKGEIVVWIGAVRTAQLFNRWEPCPVCGGSGISSCCDGASGDKEEPIKK